MTPGRVLQLNPRDNVLVALDDLRKGEQIGFSGRTLTLRTDVPAKHKFAMEDIPPGGAVVMYGVLIGKAMEPIGSGEKLRSEIRAMKLQPSTKKRKTIVGRLQTSRAGVRRLFLDTLGMMVRSARGTIGLSSRSFSAKTGTSRY